MNDHDIILAMAICQLLGKSVTPKDVEKAIEKAEERFCRPPHQPIQAKISHVRRHDETE